MRISTFKSAVACLAVAAALSSCVDDSYNLTDADNTFRLNISNLTLPVHIEPITLGDIIKIDEGSKIQPVSINGQNFYALQEQGQFTSQPIDIAGFSAEPTPIAPVYETLDKSVGSSVMGSRTPQQTVSYTMVEMGNTFSYKADNIAPAIVKVDAITTAPFHFTLNLEVDDRQSAIDRMSFTDMVISAPKGLRAVASEGTYDSASGIWTIPELVVESNRASVSLTATAVDMNVAEAYINANRSLNFNSHFIVRSGLINILASRITMPDQIGFGISFELSGFTLETFTGELKYDITGINIDPVMLTDIPEFLDGADSNIELYNPQFYLSLNNPVANVALTCTTGLEFSAYRSGEPTLSFQSERNVRLGTNHGISGPYNFVYSPDASANNVPAEFAANLTALPFSKLGKLLAAPASFAKKGLPDKIGIDLLTPQVPLQSVTEFAVPAHIGEVKGKWMLMAPVALNDGSKIVYSETRNGWGDEDLDDLTITHLSVTADADNKCPVDAVLTIWPIDAQGNNINNIEVTSSQLKANTKQTLTFEMTGEVAKLDGIRLMAVLEGVPGGKPLDASQTLTLTNLKANVSGYYQKKL